MLVYVYRILLIGLLIEMRLHFLGGALLRLNRFLCDIHGKIICRGTSSLEGSHTNQLLIEPTSHIAQLFCTDSATRNTLQNSTSVAVHINGTDFIMKVLFTVTQIQILKCEVHRRNLKITGIVRKQKCKKGNKLFLLLL